MQIWSVGQAAKLPPFHGGVRGSIPLPTMVGSWLSLRLCGRSNYRTAISVRNLAGAHAVPTGRCFYILGFHLDDDCDTTIR